MSKDTSSMTTAAYDERARGWVTRLERAEKARTGCDLDEERETVASRLGVLPGSLENLRRGRTKGIRGWIYERLRAAMIVQLQHEIAAQKHELEMLIQGGSRPDSGEIQEVLAGLAALRLTLQEGSR